MNIKPDRCECGKPVKIKAPSLCGTCYGQQWRANTLLRTIAQKSETIEQRFYKRFELETNSGCWLWTGTMTKPGGYGEMLYKGKKHRVHVLSYKLHVGPVPEGLLVCHKCDVKFCVNPNHLFVGTNADNMRDCVNKGRIARGERSGTAKLTRQQVITIRNMPDAIAGIAVSFGVSDNTVRAIKCRKTWSWLGA